VGEGDNVHSDIETTIGTTSDDVLIGNDLGQDLFGHAGRDRIEGGGGDDFLNGGTGEDAINGGAGNDTLEGSAAGDRLDGGPGGDYLAGDNPCAAEPCTGGPDEILVRDGQVDTVNCGVRDDHATLDANDFLERGHACERVDRAAPATSPSGGAPPTASAPRTPAGQVLGDDDAAGATMRVVGKRRLRGVRRRGLVVAVTCPSACRLRGRLILGRKTLASGRRKLTRGGTGKLTLRATKAGRHRLRGQKRLAMTLVVDVTDATGAKMSLTRPLTIRR
jgi:Ca2+-binding RTX toxin-like protein